jgi:hypothetical protein
VKEEAAVEMLAWFDENDASVGTMTDLKEDSRGSLPAMVPCVKMAAFVE